MPESAAAGGRAVVTVPTLDTELARRLVASQFPQWADLPVRPIKTQGWDNRTFRLGPHLSVRLPSAPGYEPQVLKEHRWLPALAGHLPLPVPEPVALGEPGEGYPLRWSVYRWIPGEVVSAVPQVDMVQVARDLAAFLRALRAAPAEDGPEPGPQTFFRGAPLAHYAPEARAAFGDLPADEAERAEAVLAAALATSWPGPPVWFHGDVAVDNLLMRDGRLAAVIDFGVSGVGDPACDTAIAWTLFEGRSRAAFVAGMALDAGTWARGRGWALWKAAITVRNAGAPPVRQAEARRTLAAVLDPGADSGS